MTFGAKCDGINNDQPAIQSAIIAAGCGNYIYLPGGKTCKLNAPLTFTTCVGFDSNGSIILTTGSAVIVKSAVPGANFTGNASPFRNLNLAGPGGNPNGSIGLLIEASNWSVQGANIHGFENGVELGSEGYSVGLHAFQVWDNYRGYYAPAGLTNAGEQITFDDDSSLFGNTYGVVNYGSEANFIGGSLDGNTYPVCNYGGAVRLTDEHVEAFKNVPIVTGSTATSARTTVMDSRFLTDGNYNLPLVENDSGYTQMEHISIAGFSNTLGFVTGLASSGASLCGISNGNTLDNIANVGQCP